jgi:hypothetical protein
LRIWKNIYAKEIVSSEEVDDLFNSIVAVQVSDTTGVDGSYGAGK